MRTLVLGLCLFALTATTAHAIGDEELRAAIEQRFKGDRTGACVAAAVLENGTTARAYVCANPATARPYDEHTAFEIGSVSKTMTAALLAEFIARGEIALDDPIAKLLPGTSVPSFEGREITVANIVTHTSGLPRLAPQWRFKDPSNPYAHLTERDLLGALSETHLTHAPGTHWEYSNFAIMVLSHALAKRGGKDFETLLQERLFGPLDMRESYIDRRPSQVRLIQGHLSTTKPTVPWDFPVDMAGVGGVRATLNDMVRYMEGQLGLRESAITPALARTQQPVANVGGRNMGMNWFLSARNGRALAMHDGGTGGYSSYVVFDRAAGRAAVLLSDTSLITVGGLIGLGQHLLDPTLPVGAPRTAAAPDAKLIDALVGRYRLRNGLGMQLRRKDNALFVQADGQSEYQMGYDSAGDFYPLQFDALLRPKRKADGTYGFTWFQSGGVLEAERLDTPAPAAAKPAPREEELKAYEGNFRLTPGFALRVYATGTRLFVQGTGQPPIEVAFVDEDTFVAETVGAEIRFARDAAARVIALTLKQSGQTLRGERE